MVFAAIPTAIGNFWLGFFVNKRNHKPNTVEWRNDMSNEQWTKSMLKLNLNSAPDLNSIWNKQITSSSQPKRLMISKWVWSLIKNTFLSCFFEICKMLITRFKLNVFGLFREKVRWAFWNFNKIWIYKTQFQLSTIRDGWLLLWIFFLFMQGVFHLPNSYQTLSVECVKLQELLANNARFFFAAKLETRRQPINK